MTKSLLTIGHAPGGLNATGPTPAAEYQAAMVKRAIDMERDLEEEDYATNSDALQACTRAWRLVREGSLLAALAIVMACVAEPSAAPLVPDPVIVPACDERFGATGPALRDVHTRLKAGARVTDCDIMVLDRAAGDLEHGETWHDGVRDDLWDCEGQLDLCEKGAFSRDRCAYETADQVTYGLMNAMEDYVWRGRL